MLPTGCYAGRSSLIREKQNLRRFLKNPVISIKKLSVILMLAMRDNIRHYTGKHILPLTTDRKSALHTKTKSMPQYDWDYELQSSLAINAADGQPPTVLAQNFATKNTVHSRYGSSDKKLH